MSVTIKDIARQAGVSIATVSRVINRNETVNPDLAAKVMDIIHATGYYPNLVARSLKVSHTKTIALVVSDISNEYFAQMSISIDRAIRPDGYSLIVCSAINDGKAEREYLQLLLEKQVEGIIINTSGFNSDYIASISRQIPVVLLHRKVENTEFHGDWIDTDIYTSAYELTKLLIDKGHRRIAVMSGPLRLSTGRMRYEGYRDAMRAHGLPAPDSGPDYYEDEFTVEAGYRGARYFMRQKCPPTAIVIMHGETTVGALRYFREHAIRVPDDVSFVSIDNIPNSDLLFIRPYQYNMQSETIGRRTAQLILERIRAGNELANRELCFSMPIIPGESVKDLTSP